MAHIKPQMLLDALQGLLVLEERDAMTRHIGQCEVCAGEFKQYAGLLDALSLPETEHAPSEAVEKANRIFQPTERSQPIVRETIASLVFDNWSGSAIAGIRGTAESRQLMLSAEGHDIHLNIDSAYIHGQLLTAGTQEFKSDFTAHLIDEDHTEIDSASANALGEFLLNRTSATEGSILIRFSDGHIIACPLPAGEEK